MMLRPQPRNIVLAVECVKHSENSFNEFPCAVRAASDLAMTSRWQDEDKSAPQLHVGRLFGKVTLVHAVPSPMLQTTELEKDDDRRLNSKPASIFSAAGRDAFRRTAVNAAVIQAPANDPLPEPANDTDWPEAA